MRRWTPGAFVAEATRVHKGRYKYPGLRFVHSSKKIDIDCPAHGIFQQRPQKHLAGQGCPKCKPKPKPQSREDFIKNACTIHGDKYDYSRVDYVNNHTPVIIVCKAAGHVFEMIPSNHTHPKKPQGCKRCKGIEPWTTQRFLKEAPAVHGDRYDYSKVEVTNGRKKVDIICRVHGAFRQSPIKHIDRRQGCIECAGVKRGSTEGFVDRARRAHGDRFSYDLVVYRSKRESVRIICNTCGFVFEQMPWSHLLSRDPCPRCSGRAVDSAEFTKRARLKHGDRYDYSESIYVNASTPVRIICPYHGSFVQLPNVHVSGSGCSVCRNSLGNESIRSCLEKAGIDFEEEHAIRDGGGRMPLRFDFVIIQSGVPIAAIEFHGVQHFRPVSFGSGRLTADEQFALVKARDQRKRDWCLRNGIELLEISGVDEAGERAVNFAVAALRKTKMGSVTG